MKKILFATGNPSKAKRFSKGLEKKGIEVITLEDINTEIEVEENGKNAIENALIKARAYSKVVDIPVFAMDDNLYLENVPEEKQPGMFVRRVNGKRLSDDEMIKHYSNLVKEYGINGKLICRWVYGMAVINNGKESTYTWSKDDFYMVDVPSKKVNPGYPLNTISIHKKLNKYFTDITDEDKAMVEEDESHVVDFIANSIENNVIKFWDGKNIDISNIEVNTQSSIKLRFDKIIYFDPYKIEDSLHDADIIFITHNHYDHMDVESINKIKNDNTIIVAPKSMEAVIKNIELREYIFLNPSDEINIDGFNIKAIPAYNVGKTFHPRENNWLGYIITYNNISYYIAGDTDKTIENEKVKCDVALIPIGGHFTMDVNEAAELIRTINPKIVIPIHYGSIIGAPGDGKRLKEKLFDTNIEVIEKLHF